MPNRGTLIVFEGPDGVGKSTLAKSLMESLRSTGEPCEIITFPGKESGTLGNLVYELHHNPKNYSIEQINPTSVQILHIAAHVDAIERKIIPMLNKGHNIILDRYWWSTWVYGVTSNVHRKTLKLMIDIELHHWNTFLPAAVFLIDRNHSLHNSVTISEMNKLRDTYFRLMDEEKYKYPVYRIHNDNSPENALNEIICSLDNLRLRNEEALIEDYKNHVSALDHNYDVAQLGFHFDREPQKTDNHISNLTIFTRLRPAVPTDVFNTYWRFTSERQNIFFRKLEGIAPPWTKDPILLRYKFTNAYRASDRVSQYLIKNVIYRGDQSPTELFFRILLFKVFNKIETWELFEEIFGEISYSEYSFEKYDSLLTKTMNNKKTIFSGAYIMPSGKHSFGSSSKHRNYLRLIENMIDDDVPRRIADFNSMQEVFNLLRSYPMIGDFLAYQYAIDINYSEMTHFSESEFVMPGPGAKDGIRKTFKDYGGLNEIDIIKLMVDRQEEEFLHLEIEFKSLWGRSLQLIDCQNLFCEVDKYARKAHPNIIGISSRKRIKQTYKPKKPISSYWYPPKWGINHLTNHRED
jgi:thymidylate kinase